MSGRVVVVTGTGTEVGKTVATAALATLAGVTGGDVVAVKPVQTGIADDEPGDAEEVRRLAGCAVVEHARLAHPLAPETAARLTGEGLLTIGEHADRVRALAAAHDTVLVEGAGGLLVRLDDEGGTLLDLAVLLSRELPVEVVVVVTAGLGTLNHAGLTVAALRSHGLEPAGLVVGSWPSSPGLAERCNLHDLPRVTGVPLLGVVPEGAGSWAPDRFRAAAPGWFR